MIWLLIAILFTLPGLLLAYIVACIDPDTKPYLLLLLMVLWPFAVVYMVCIWVHSR